MTLFRLREEIDENIGEKSIIETKDLDSLVYLDMVIKETLRLASPASMTSRKIVKDNYEIGGYKIPKGTNVLVCVKGTEGLVAKDYDSVVYATELE